MDTTSGTLDHHQQALAWLVTMWSGEVTAEDQLALNNWRQASAAHEQAWLDVQRIHQRLRAVPAETGGPVLRAAARRGGRRAVLRGLALVGCGGVALHTLRDSVTWQAMTAQYATATGERRDLVLDDGTRIAMNTATALDVRFDAGQRRIDLHRGEIMISTAKDHGMRDRAFVVHTAHGTARALGTRFVAYQSGAYTEIKVYEGAVEVRARAGQGAPHVLAAGRQARFTDGQAGPLVQRALSPNPPAWMDGMLEAEQMRLEDFLAELSRYRRGAIQCDPAVADLVVSGMYPLDDTDKVLTALAQALPLRVAYLTRYWVNVQAR